MIKPFINAKVPLNSTLKVTVSGTGDADQQAFVARGTLEFPDLSREEWLNAELRAGLTRSLTAAGAFVGKVDILPVRPSTIQIQMELRDPGGQVIGSYDESAEVSGNLDRTNILLVVPLAMAAAAPKKAAKPAGKAGRKAAAKASKGGSK
jgi:hypothetical protein